MLDRMLSTFSLASRIPLRAKFAFDPSRIDFWLPVVGVVPALLNLLVFVALALAGDIPERYPFLTATLLVIAQYLCFNLFHLDGLMDTADAFLGGCSKEKRLAILKDSRIGVYGFFAGFALLALKLALLSAVLPYLRGGLVIAAVLSFPIVGRFSAVLIPCMTTPATAGGLGRLAEDSRWVRCALGAVTGFVLWALLACGVTLLVGLVPGVRFVPNIFCIFDVAATVPAAVVVVSFAALAPLTAFFYARLYRRNIGGYTGDALGAAVETGELLCLAVAFAMLNNAGYI
jgi:adenosylcobinamide-GDP ribazoletransferase